MKENIEDKGGELIMVTSLIHNETARYIDLKNEYDRANMDYDRQFTYSNIVTKPYPADKKSYPVRWLIVVISTLAVFFLSFVGVMVVENYRNIVKTA